MRCLQCGEIITKEVKEVHRSWACSGCGLWVMVTEDRVIKGENMVFYVFKGMPTMICPSGCLLVLGSEEV